MTVSPDPTWAPENFGPLLQRYGMRLEPGSLVYAQGAVTGLFYFVLGGRVVFEVVDAGGARAVVHEAFTGDCFGHVSAFSGRPTSAAATTAEPTTLIAVPTAQALEAFRTMPELALAVISQFANADRPRRQAPRDVDDVSAEAPERAKVATEQSEVPSMTGVDGTFDEASYFKDDVACPVCETRFDYLRVRTGAVRPAARDSDFRISYRTVDPTLYAVTVCPECSFAAYIDEFEHLGERERDDLLLAQTNRERFGRPNLCGERNIDGAAAAFDLALECYNVRRPDERRRAGLLHRRAWLERSRGDAEAERAMLQQAVGAYKAAYEADKNITDAGAMRAAYLIGDLTYRLGDPNEAAMWLSMCLHGQDDKTQSGIIRLARERLQEARVLLQSQKAA